MSEKLQQSEEKLHMAAKQEVDTIRSFTVELEMAREEAQQRLEAAVKAERESMMREAAGLIKSLKQDYEIKLATVSASIFHHPLHLQ